MVNRISVKEMLKKELFNTSDLICTKKSFTNTIETVTIMDIPDIVNWVKENELIIIGRFMEYNFDVNFIKQLSQRNISGIITKKKFKQFISQSEIDAALHFNIPIILIDDDYAWSEVTTTVQELQFQKQLNIIKDTEKFHKTILNYLRDNHGLNDLCSSIYNVTNLSIAITDSRFNLLDASFDYKWKKVIENITTKDLIHKEMIGYNMNNRIIQGYRYKNKLIDTNSQIIFIKNKDNKNDVFYLLIKIPIEINILTPETLAKLETIESIYQLKKTFYQEVLKTNLVYRDLAFEELLNLKKASNKNRNHYSLILGTRLELSYQVILVKNYKWNTTYDLIHKATSFSEFYNEFYKTYFTNQNILIFSRQEYWVLLVGDSQKNINIFINSLVQFLTNFFQHDSFYVGIGGSSPYYHLSSSWKEAEHSLHYLEKRRSNEKFQNYNDLGILKLFTNEAGNINELFIEQILNQYIIPIINHDKQYKSELLNTLETYIENNFSHTNTSECLFIHKNTLRARFKKIEKLLSINLNKSDHLMNMFLAIRLYQVNLSQIND
ncbi:PucR family transcriptional regulator [Vagococcus sp.]|uniref:PucR family transcriptional regulator n=1 Tax=Vagococcus sp. TaxID=1933889 RepID=UPI003F94A110